MLVRRISDAHDMTFGNGFGNFAYDAEAVAQSVHTRLLLIQDEWFLDVDAGVPYLQSIMVKPANLSLAEALIKKSILETDGVDSIESFSMLFNQDTRRMVVTAGVKTQFDDLTQIKVVL
jgi:hypothetical protein